MPKQTEKPVLKRRVRKKKLPPRPPTHKPKHAPRPRIFHFVALDGTKYSLTPQQKRYVDAYLSLQFTGGQSVVEAGYAVQKPDGSVDWILASSISTENLSKPAIKAYIRKELDTRVLTKEFVDTEHAFIIGQREDLAAKNRSIDIYNKIHKRYAPDQIEIKQVDEFSRYSDEQLDQIIKTGKNIDDTED